MKITFLYQYFGTPAGSWSTRVYEFTKRWVNAGHEVTVITSPYSKSDIKCNSFIDVQNVEGIKLIVINSGDNNLFPMWRRAMNALLFAFFSTIYHFKTNSDITIASSGPITIGIPALLGKLILRKKYVFEVRDLWPDGAIVMGKIQNRGLIKLSRLLEKTIYKYANIIVTASLGQTNHIKNRFPNKRYLTIPNASDIDLFVHNEKKLKNQNVLFSKPLFLHIGSLGFIHNCTHIINAALILKQKGYEGHLNIVFIGDGSERVELERMIKLYSISNVFFVGLIPKREVPSWLNNAHATLFSTLNNPIQDTCSPNKIFDSFAAGIPIIQTTQGWIKDLVDQNYCGINVHPVNAEELADAMIYICNNESERIQMGNNAFKLANNVFNRDLLSSQYLNELIKTTN